MAFNIQTFADNIATYGNLQTNKFEINLQIPRFLIRNQAGVTNELLTLRADRVDLPGILFDTTETRRYGVGPIIKTPSNKSKFNDITISFIETHRGSIYTLFTDWLQGIVDFSGGQGSTIAPTFLTEYKNRYSVPIGIKVFNNLGTNRNEPGTDIQPVLELNLIEAFPLSLSDTNLSWSNNNEIFKTNVTFSYTYHQLVTRAGATPLGV